MYKNHPTIGIFSANIDAFYSFAFHKNSIFDKKNQLWDFKRLSTRKKNHFFVYRMKNEKSLGVDINESKISVEERK